MEKLDWIDVQLALDADGLAAYPFGKVFRLRNQISIEEAEKINQDDETDVRDVLIQNYGQ
jgi:hypothetical protein